MEVWDLRQCLQRPIYRLRWLYMCHVMGVLLLCVSMGCPRADSVEQTAP